MKIYQQCTQVIKKCLIYLINKTYYFLLYWNFHSTFNYMLINWQQRITHESLIVSITNNSLRECVKSVFNEWGSMWDLIIENNYHQYQKTLLSNFTLVHFKRCRFVIEVLYSNPEHGPSWSWSHGSWIYNYMCNQCISQVTFWVQVPLWWGMLDTTLCDKVFQGNFRRVAKQCFH